MKTYELTDRRLRSGFHLGFDLDAGSRSLSDYSASRTTGKRLSYYESDIISSSQLSKAISVTLYNKNRVQFERPTLRATAMNCFLQSF